MLNVFRDNLRHLKWLLLIVAASMLLYLGLYFDTSSGRGGRENWAARVGGEPIDVNDFINEARRRDDRYRQMFGGQYDQIKKQLRVGNEAIEALVARHIILGEAKRLGLEATPEELSRQIQARFSDASGTFVGKDRYVDAVSRSFPGGVAEYERSLAEEIAVQKWMDLMSEGARVTDADVERAYRARSERAAVDYVFVAPGKVAFPSMVDDGAIAAWYESHKDAYRRGEARKIRFAVVDRQSQLAKVKVGDEEIKAFYDANQAEYRRPEQRHARHILFHYAAKGAAADRQALRQLAESVLKRAKGGEDFATLARSMSQDTDSAAKGGDLGWVGRNDLTPPLAQAVFSTPPGQYAPVVESDVGLHVVQVLEARGEGVLPLDEMKEPIKRQLELRRAQDAIQAEAQKLRSEVSSPADLDRAAAAAGLKVEEAVIAEGDRSQDFGPSPDFLSALSAAGKGGVFGPAAVARGTAVGVVVDVLPPGVRPLSEVRERVRAEILNERSGAAAVAAARAVLAGHDLAAVAKAYDSKVQSSPDLTPGLGTLPGVGAVPELTRVLFAPGAAAGATGVISAAGGAVAYKITKVETFDPAKFQASKDSLRAELLESRKGEILQSAVDTLRKRQTVEINDKIVSQVNG